MGLPRTLQTQKRQGQGSERTDFEEFLRALDAPRCSEDRMPKFQPSQERSVEVHKLSTGAVDNSGSP
jgi:hypothetical protein